jgi:hypothetical protein
LIFLLVNASLLVVALFDVRAALIALFLMLPNIVGTLGGAEKVGWSTHYQDEYLPALIWAALLGFVKAYATWPRIRYRAALLGGVALVIVFLALLNPSLQLFPIDLDHADYAVLVATGTGPATIYTGVTDFWGPQDTLAANEVVVTRMKRDGYDFAHPVYTAPNGLTVIRRIPRTS